MENACGMRKSIEAQIESCRQLLAVFQEERGVYQQGRSLTAAELTSTLERKKRLVDLFENQRNLMKALENAPDCQTDEAKAERKNLTRSLATLLEQLIVIDQENERLMREAATTTRRPQASSPFALRQRPALQRRLPLMPFGGVQQKAPEATPVVAPAPAPALSAKPVPAALLEEKAVEETSSAAEPVKPFKAPSVGIFPVRPKSHLKVYSSNSVRLNA